MLHGETNRAQRVQRLLRAAGRHGLSRSSLLSAAGLEESQISDPDARIPVQQTLRIWQRIADAIDDPDIGLEVGVDLQVREGGVVGYAMAHSTNMLGALRRITRFARLINQRSQLSLTNLGDRWRLQAENRPLLPHFRPPIDEGLSGVMQGLREIVGQPFVPAGLRFSYSRPARTSTHRRLFGPNLFFSEAKPAIEIWNRDVVLPTSNADPKLTSYLDELAEIQLDRLPRLESWVDRVRQVVWPHLSEGVPAIRDVAGELAMSSRSLQRRLREENTSFAQIVSALRRDKARLLLEDASLAVYEIGFLLGYADPSAFHRAFRRWEGVSPKQYRALQLDRAG